MLGCLRSCLGKLAALVVIVALAWAGTLAFPEAVPTVRAWFTGEEPADEEEGGPSPRLAESTLERFEAFRAGAGEGSLSLGQDEISAVVRFSFPGILPPGVKDPRVEMADGKLELSARVATADFPDIGSLREVVGFLPDTVEIRMRGSLLPFDDERGALHVDRIRAMGIPLPDHFTPKILETLGRRHERGLPADAMLVPLPDGIASAYILRDSLVLVGDE